MTDENLVLAETAALLESAGIDYMLTGSMALNYYATPRMTRDVDFVAAIYLKDVEKITDLFHPDHYYISEEAVKDAVKFQSSFNVIDQKKLVKVDIMIRKREKYRLLEFERRKRIEFHGAQVWIVSREDLILSKLAWADGNTSSRQLDDVKNLLAGKCDMDYLKSWANYLNLTDILTLVTA
jgi:hypothetical protein